MNAKCKTISCAPENELKKSATRHQASLCGSTAPTLQPTWVHNHMVLDTILSFVSLEDKTMCLRAVCRGFNDSILRQLRFKVLDQAWLPIMFDRFEYDGSVFRADARRGWSNELNIHANVIDWTLLTMGCRCQDSLCKDYRECLP